ncbi:hypothetical protein [Bacillus pseudomycoides]|nr:hypothetical protein [Bacillus pseudomycoides]
MTLICLEGASGIGKTTTCRSISKGKLKDGKSHKKNKNRMM